MPDVVSLLREMIRIPSVNPMGRDIDGPEFLEAAMSDFLCGYFAGRGIAHARYELQPRRANVVAWLEGTGSQTILLDAHQDTVPVDGMTISPFEGIEQDGKIFGRGACDVKGGLAAMMTAFSRLAELPQAKRPRVILSCTCDEEATSLGINALARMWTDSDSSDGPLSTAPTYAVIAEPTELHVVVAHRGATRWKLHTHGRACHSSEPKNGVNAIYAMSHVLAALEEYARMLPDSRPAHPLCGPATLSVGRIDGGASVNVVPERCSIEIDRRVIPGEDSYAVIEEVEAFLKERIPAVFTMDAPWVTSPPLDDSDNGELAARLLRYASHVDPTRQAIGVAYGTHASRTALAGVPSVVFGPGSIEQAHTKDEWIACEQLEQAAQVYYDFCKSFASAP